MTPLSSLHVFVATGFASLLAGGGAAAAEPPPVRIAYFVPADREIIPGYVERLERCMVEVRRFYQDGMISAGYGPMTFSLERDSGGKLRVYLVRGKHPMATYGRDAAGPVRDEVKAAMTSQGVDIDRETVVIFQVLLRWDGDKAVEVGPYVGGGDHLAGTAWVYDDERLDPRELGSKKPGGFYVGPCSIGEFNSHYIGGIAHELGHAFGLPHDAEKGADRKRGTSLMGSGNHTYGNDLRKEGSGSFLSPASALPLASIRAFAGDRADARMPASCRFRKLDAAVQQGTIVLTGEIEASPPVYGLVAYNDPVEPPADYDAVGWTCRPGTDGRFRLVIGDLKPGACQLRLRFCHLNGASSGFSFDYRIDEQGRPDVGIFRYSLALGEAVKAFAAGDKTRAAAQVRELRARFKDLPAVQARAALLERLLNPPAPQKPERVAAAAVPVSSLEFRSASVGWGRPLRDQALVEGAGQCFLAVGGELIESGLFAHAPSRYELELGGKWKRLRAGFGLQDGHAGSVVFVIRADGRELFRSPRVSDQKRRTMDVSIDGVNRLELLVEDAGDGPGNDWAVWIDPRLER